MIGTLARKRTSLVALMAVLALVAAMFAAFAPARAAEGDVSANEGYCLLNGTTYKIQNEDGSTDVTVEQADQSTTTISCAKADAGKKAKITPNGTISPTVEILEPELVLSLGSAAKAPGSVAVKAYVKNGLATISYSTLAPSAAASISPASSGAALIGTPAADQTVDETGAAAALTTVTNVFLSPSASGTYTVTVLVKDSSTTPNYLIGTKDITLGETAAAPDKKVASATLELDYSAYDAPLTSANEGVKETGTTPAGSGADIWLKLTVKNSLDEAADNADLESVTIVGLNGTIGLYSPQTANPQRYDENAQLGSDGTHALTNSTATEVTNTMFVKVGSTTATKVAVYAQINGQSVTSNTVNLTFTGTTSKIALSEATKTLKTKDDTLKLTVTGIDAGGNEGTNIAAASVGLRVVDSAGKTASNVTAAAAQAKMADGTNDDPAKVEVTVTVSATTAAKSGTYTLEATFGTDKKTVDFNIAGSPATVELSADPATGTRAGERITVTATVTDEAGVLVADGTPVAFSSTTGGGASIIGTGNTTTKDGVATVTLGVSSAGTTFIYADAGEPSSASADLTFTSTAVPPTVGDEPPTGAGCVTNQSGFSTYKCEDSDTLGALFTALGAGAVSVWDADISEWKTYNGGGLGSVSASTRVYQYDSLYID